MCCELGLQLLLVVVERSFLYNVILQWYIEVAAGEEESHSGMVLYRAYVTARCNIRTLLCLRVRTDGPYTSSCYLPLSKVHVEGRVAATATRYYASCECDASSSPWKYTSFGEVGAVAATASAARPGFFHPMATASG